jgi:hypothetical protein
VFFREFTSLRRIIGLNINERIYDLLHGAHQLVSTLFVHFLMHSSFARSSRCICNTGVSSLLWFLTKFLEQLRSVKLQTLYFIFQVLDIFLNNAQSLFEIFVVLNVDLDQ